MDNQSQTSFHTAPESPDTKTTPTPNGLNARLRRLLNLRSAKKAVERTRNASPSPPRLLPATTPRRHTFRGNRPVLRHAPARKAERWLCRGFVEQAERAELVGEGRERWWFSDELGEEGRIIYAAEREGHQEDVAAAELDDGGGFAFEVEGKGRVEEGFLFVDGPSGGYDDDDVGDEERSFVSNPWERGCVGAGNEDGAVQNTLAEGAVEQDVANGVAAPASTYQTAAPVTAAGVPSPESIEEAIVNSIAAEFAEEGIVGEEADRAVTPVRALQQMSVDSGYGTSANATPPQDGLTAWMARDPESVAGRRGSSRWSRLSEAEVEDLGVGPREMRERMGGDWDAELAGQTRERKEGGGTWNRLKRALSLKRARERKVAR